MKPDSAAQAAPLPRPSSRPTLPAGLVRWLHAVARYYPVALILLLWELCSRIGLFDPLFVPALSDVLQTWYVEMFVTHDLLVHIAYSFGRASIGFAMGATVGIMVGILMGRVRAIESFVDPLISAIFPTPKLAIFPLMMVFLGIGDASKIALIFLGCFFPIVIATYAGVKNVDKYFIWNARTKGANSRQVMWTVVFPAAMPFVFAGLRTAMLTAFLLIVASELIAANEGLGYLIIFAQRTFNPTLMFAGVLTVSTMGFIADRLLQALGRRLFRWQEQAER
ncbi:ABC transporter permease [Vineibacter terrae]|uniref:ABC transporter permease n=1 Tax=Vineibacter terrae TaxID=2586908 RepID=A0A5C8PJC6_9HYPH|nr:ABC transporter permease [Vineibacter terrae]TXL73465.1 ABC transporter permease [Vineibacter terrae]